MWGGGVTVLDASANIKEQTVALLWGSGVRQKQSETTHMDRTVLNVGTFLPTLYLSHVFTYFFFNS